MAVDGRWTIVDLTGTFTYCRPRLVCETDDLRLVRVHIVKKGMILAKLTPLPVSFVR